LSTEILLTNGIVSVETRLFSFVFWKRPLFRERHIQKHLKGRQTVISGKTHTFHQCWHLTPISSRDTTSIIVVLSYKECNLHQHTVSTLNKLSSDLFLILLLVLLLLLLLLLLLMLLFNYSSTLRKLSYCNNHAPLPFLGQQDRRQEDTLVLLSFLEQKRERERERKKREREQERKQESMRARLKTGAKEQKRDRERERYE